MKKIRLIQPLSESKPENTSFSRRGAQRHSPPPPPPPPPLPNRKRDKHGHGPPSPKTTRFPSPTPKASDALPLPLYLTNAIFFTFFFYVAYFLLHRWRDKIRNCTPLHVVTLFEIAAMVSLIASFIYLLGFFGIDFVQSFISRASHDAWDLEDTDPPPANYLVHDHRLITCPPAVPANIASVAPQPPPKPSITPLASEEDEEIVRAVVDDTIPSYSLELKLGDCKRTAAIRRKRCTG